MAPSHERANQKGAGRVAIRSGRAFRVDSPAANGIVVPALACEVERSLERFAVDAGATAQAPIGVYLKPGIFGHHRVGRAADIYAVGGVGLDAWKERWDLAMARARGMPDAALRAAIISSARNTRSKAAAVCSALRSTPSPWSARAFTAAPASPQAARPSAR